MPMHTRVARFLPLAFLLPLACAPAEYTPGLHTMMVDLQFRHANVWFAGVAGNWPLAHYHMHEIEELTDDIIDGHSTYDDVPVAELMRSLLVPSVVQLAAAIDAGDHAAFETAYDALTAQCNACHLASAREMIVIQRPTSPPFDNVRFAPPTDRQPTSGDVQTDAGSMQ